VRWTRFGGVGEDGLGEEIGLGAVGDDATFVHEEDAVDLGWELFEATGESPIGNRMDFAVSSEFQSRIRERNSLIHAFKFPVLSRLD
jgi:hypothetical protein